jgi:ribosomal protein L17
LRQLYESDEVQAITAPPRAAELLKFVDRLIRFARAGIEGARRRPQLAAAEPPWD